MQLPENSQSFNRYSYCLNNPLKYTDPTGENFLAALAINVGVSMFCAAAEGENVWRAAAFGALGACASYGTGCAFGHTAGNVGRELLRAGAHGISGGVQSALQGGSFFSGFASGATASMAGSGAQWAGWNNAGVLNATTAGGAFGAWVSGSNPISGAMLGYDIGLLNHSWKVSTEGYVYDASSPWERLMNRLGLGSIKENLFDYLYLEGSDRLLATFPEGTINLTQNSKISTVLEIKNSKMAERFFRAAVFNTNVEWAKITHAGKVGISHTLVSDHKHNAVSSAVEIHLKRYLRMGESVFSMSHSHPVSDSERNGNMGAWANIDPSDDDLIHADHYPHIIFSIYNLYNNMRQYYNGQGVYKQIGF